MKLKVVAAVAMAGVIEDYESAFREAGFNPGVVLPSTLAAIGAADGKVPTLVIKVDAHTTSIAILNEDQLQLFRTLENTRGVTITGEQLAEEVYPSVVFFQDTYHLNIERIYVAGLAGVGWRCACAARTDGSGGAGTGVVRAIGCEHWRLRAALEDGRSGGSVDCVIKEASQTRDYCVANNATLRAARLGPSRRKLRAAQDDKFTMRLDINLASQPYEDARQFWMRWGTAVGALGLLTLVLLALDMTGWVNARRDRQAIAEKRALIAERDELRANAERILNLPENRSTRDQSQFLNELIERKAFSWTRVLENLEKVMPPRVHLVSISPQLDEDNQLGLKMMVAGDSRERAMELARRMEESRRFAQTQIISEHFLQGTTGDTEQFEIAAVYIPEALSAGASAPKTEAKPKTESKPKTTDTKTKGGTQPRTTPARGNH